MLPIMVFERWVFRRNPQEWREQIFIIEDTRRPHEMAEIEGAIGKELERDVDESKMIYLNLKVSRNSKLNPPKTDSAASKKKAEALDMRYKWNPLYLRYKFLIFLFVFFSGISLFVYPIGANKSKSDIYLCNSSLKSNPTGCS
jgi:hypothetical protein